MRREHLWEHHEADANVYWKLAEGGYPGKMSVRAGEEITLHISNSRGRYPLDIYREGAAREHMLRIDGLRGELQDVPTDGYREGFGWTATVRLEIPRDWRSGVYIAAFPTAQGPREILFVVRSTAPRSPLLLTLSANTYQAYNNVGGKCFYNYLSTDNEHAKVVSFERPLQPNALGNFTFWDQFFVSWLDSEGYEIDYCVNSDHDLEPDLLGHYRANLRIGHDEYNSRAECEQLQTFVAGGGNLLLFAGNAFCLLTELRNNGRQLYCAKPHYHNRPTPERPETSYLNSIEQLRQRTIGLDYTSYVNAKKGEPGSGQFYAPVTDDRFGHYWVVDPSHWVFEGTGLREGETFGGDDSIVGVEVDAADLEFVDGRPVYTGSDGVSPEYRIVALANASAWQLDLMAGIQYRKTDGDATAWGTIAINETEHAGTVFNAATIEWGHGLFTEGSPVPIITRNVLDRLAFARKPA